MEPSTFLLLASIPAIAAGVYLLIQKRRELRKPESKAVRAARERSRQRGMVRAFADTQPANIREDLEYSTRGVTVVDNTGGLPLTDEQIHTINLIFQGCAPDPVHFLRHKSGPSSTMAAGVPLCNTVLDEHNTVAPKEEVYICKEFEWPKEYLRG